MICVPTLHLLPQLYSAAPDVQAAKGTLERARATQDQKERLEALKSLRLQELDDPLLNDARTRFADGRTPDQHKSSTKEVREPIYEVRDRVGAACRGAMWVGDGAAWLVHLAAHNRFHATAASYFHTSKDWRPGPLDAYVLKHENAARALDRWKCDVLSEILAHLRAVAIDNTGAGRLTVTNLDGSACHIDLTVDHDPPGSSPPTAHSSSAMLDILVHFKSADFDLAMEVLQLLCLMHNGDAALEAEQVSGGEMRLLLTITHARLAQLATTLEESQGTRPPDGTPKPAALHYLARPDIVKGMVLGCAARAVCGVWLVPRYDENVGLPVCPDCEQAVPVAQSVLDRLRERGGAGPTG